MVEDTEFPNNVSVVSWKAKEMQNRYEVDFGVHDIRSISSIRPEDIVRQLVLSKAVIDEGGTTEEYALRQEEEVKKFMPYFIEAFDIALKKGVRDEDN